MIRIQLDNTHNEFIAKYAEYQNIGGFSNLSKADLAKASRLDFQFTGIAGEVGWGLHRYTNLEKLAAVLDYKFKTLRPANKGDGGFDDSITYNNKTRLVDIKATHVEDEGRIKYLNLVIPPREFHQNMIYVCAFTIGKSRDKIDTVILAGWEINECITEKWKYDSTKYCVPVAKLRPMKELDIYIR